MSLIPTIFRFLIHVSVSGPLVVIIAYIHDSLIKIARQKHFGISILDKSVILRLLFCVFGVYSVLTYAYDYLNYWLPDRIKTINWIWKGFHDWVCQVLLKMHKNI